MLLRCWLRVCTTAFALAINPTASLAQSAAPTEPIADEAADRLSREEWKQRVEEKRRRITAERQERRLVRSTPPYQDLEKIATERAMERAMNDSTLEPGDIVSTSKGFLMFKGRSGSDADRNEFIPLTPR